MERGAPVALVVVLLVVAASSTWTGAAAGGTNRLVWASRFDGASHTYDRAIALAVNPDGNAIYVTGSSDGMGTSFDYLTIAYAAGSGRSLWRSRYNGPDALSYDDPTAIAVSPDGTRVFVTGRSGADFGPFDFATVAYDGRTGKRLWMARYSASDRSTELPAAAATSPDGSTVFVTGFTSWPTGQHDIVTVAYDAITGAKRWVARHDEDLCDLAAALAVAPSGDRVFVAGSIGPECSSSSEDFLTVAYDAATGGQRWEARYDGPGHGQDFILDAGTNVDSSTVFVTGDSVGQVSDNVATIAYDATTGLARWTARYEGPDDNHEFAQRMAVDPAGKAVYVTGTTYTEEGPLVTIAYDAISGTLRWDTQSNGGTSWGLAVAPDGTRVYAAADADGFLAVAYRTDTGAVIGVARFDPDPSDEYVRDIGISPNGRLVFATGFSYRTHSLDDYTTVAFAT